MNRYAIRDLIPCLISSVIIILTMSFEMFLYKLRIVFVDM